MLKSLVVAAGLLLTSAATVRAQIPADARSAAAVDATLRRYSNMVVAMDHAGIAALFTADGEVVNPGQATITGREAIERMLQAFAGFQVLQNETTPANTVVTGDSATQTGSYHQRVRTPSGQTVEVSGVFTAQWLLNSNGEWHIRRMETKPTVLRN